MEESARLARRLGTADTAMIGLGSKIGAGVLRNHPIELCRPVSRAAAAA